MIAVDSCSLIAFLQGETAWDTTLLAEELASDALCLPPVVYVEVASNPRHDKAPTYLYLKKIQLLDIGDQYWHRAAELRKQLLAKNLKAKLGDALIAQSCIDHRIPLLTRDTDFRHYAEHCGLTLARPL